MKNGASVQCWTPVVWRTPLFMDKDKAEHPAWTGVKKLRDDAAMQIQKFAQRYDYLSGAANESILGEGTPGADPNAPVKPRGGKGGKKR
jgi:ribosomal protein L31